MIQTATLEFLSRGLLWLRILIISLFMPTDIYGYLLLIITAEALFGTVVSYPQVKDTLMRSTATVNELGRTFAFFWVLLVPFSIASFLYFDSLITTLVVTSAGGLFAASQVLLYMLRVSNLTIYNRAKVQAAIVSTLVFLTILPHAPNYLPLVSATYGSILLLHYIRQYPSPISDVWKNFALKHALGNWTIFGTQAAVVSTSQFGGRFVVGVALSLVEVAVFTKSYMIAGGATFYFAAIMIHFEKELSRELSRDQLVPRLRYAAVAACYLLGGLALYFGFVIAVWLLEPLPVIVDFFDSVSPEVFATFTVLFAFQAIHLCLNPIVIALGRRTVSLYSSVVSLFVQATLVAIFWNELSLVSIAIITTLGQVIIILTLAVFGLRSHGAQTGSMES